MPIESLFYELVDLHESYQYPLFKGLFQKKAFLLLVNKFPAFLWTWLFSALSHSNPVQNHQFYLSRIISNIILQYITIGVRGSAVRWNTGVQAERFRFLFPMSSLGFYTDSILPPALWALESTRSLTKINTRGICWGVKAAGA